MNEMKQPTQTRENNTARSLFWGTIALDVIAMLVFGYFLAFLQGADKTPVVYVGMAVFLATFLAALSSLILTIRGRQKLGAEIVLYSLSVLGITMIAIFQGRTPTASLSILTISAITILYLLPSQSRRWYLSVTAISFTLMWVIEWIAPSWRIQLAAAKVGPAAVIVFAVILAAMVARQAWSGNIRVKIITAFTLVALTSLSILGIVTYTNYRNQVREDIRQRLLNIVSLAALQQNSDLHTSIQNAGEETTDAYKQIKATNFAIVSSEPAIDTLYTMRMNGQGQIYFVVDTGQAWDEDTAAVAEVYEDPSTLLAENFATLDHPIVEEDFYTDKFGSFLSAYAPFYRQDGTREGVIGVDFVSDTVIAEERAVLYLILVTIAVTMVLVTLLGLFLGNVFTNPIIHLSQVAQKITAGDLDARAEVETTDEVGNLALTLNTMTSQLQGTLQGLEQRVADRTRNLELAAEVGRAVSQVRDLNSMLKDASELILKEFDLYYVQVYLTDPSQRNLILEAGTGDVGVQLLGRGHSLPLNTGSLNGRAAVEKTSVVIPDTAQSSTFRKNPLLPETRGEMAVPLIVGNKVVGVLDMQSSVPGVLTDEILPAFEALAGQMAVAIQNANLLAETEQARAQVEAQARRLVREGWNEHLDAIHKPEYLGYVFAQNSVTPLAFGDEAPISNNKKAVSAPLAVAGEALGSLVVEMDDEASAEQTTELVNIVARQVAQQIENLRLLESAERYRSEAEQAARLQTVEGWQKYIGSRTADSLGYLYDTKEVRPKNGNSDVDASMFALPLKVRDEQIGNISVQGLTQDNQEEVELANVVAERLSEHIESLRLFEETKQGQVELTKRARQLSAVAEISTASSQELEVDKLLSTVVKLTQRQFDLYHAHVFIFNEATQELQIAACGWQEGDEHEGTTETVSIPLDKKQSLVARAARTKKAVIVNDVKGEPGWLANELLPNTAAEMAVPLVIGDRVLGVLDVQADRVNAFTDEDANIQTTLASQVATAMQNARSFSLAQKQAERESMLNTINQKIQSATSVEAVLQIAARELGHALGAPMAVAQLSMKDKS